jgi:hypothetical protein
MHLVLTSLARVKTTESARKWNLLHVMLRWIRDSLSSWLRISTRSSSGRSGNLVTTDNGIESEEEGSCLEERNVEPDPKFDLVEAMRV